MHRGLIAHQRDTQRYDGLTAAERAIVTHYGTGIAVLTLEALAGLRADITQVMSKI